MKNLFTTPRRAALLSVISNSILVFAKIAVGLLTGSVAIISEGIHSGLDLLAAVIAFCSVSLAARPADSHHPWGHGKIENVSGTVEALLILAAVWFIAKEALHKLLHPAAHIQNLDLGLLVMLLSIVVNILVSRILFTVARAHESPALEADAHHLSTDVLTSAGVLAGLALVRFTGLHWLDPAVALGVAALMGFIGARVLKDSFVDLLDQKLPEDEERKIQAVIERHSGCYIEYHKMRSRRAGAIRYVELHLVVPDDATMRQAHAFCDHIEKEIQGEIPNIYVTIHLESEAN